MTTPAAATIALTAANGEVRHRFTYRTQAGADRAAQRIARDLRQGAKQLVLLDDAEDMPPCRLEARDVAYVRVTYHHTAPAAPARALVPWIDHQARASGERED